jgi:muramoyltetrapeptide carboxypeptidase
MTLVPPYLKKGDCIGIMCPAGYMESARTEACISTLKKWGFRVFKGKTVGGKSRNYFSGNDSMRLDELQQMLEDDRIKAILFGRGGYGTSRILDQIDFNRFRRKPKWLIGFSDISILHFHLQKKLGIASIHGPMAAAFLSEKGNSPATKSLLDTLTGKSAAYSCAPHPFNITGKTTAEITGGNLSMLIHSLGTPSEPITKNKILFLEDVGEYLYHIDRMMLQLERTGKLGQLKGLIFGGFTELKDTTRPFGLSVEEILRQHVAHLKIPISFGFPVGHGKENVAIKCGMRYRFEVRSDMTVLVEA